MNTKEAPLVSEDTPPTNNGVPEDTPARQDVDVLLNVENLEVDKIKLTVRGLRAHVSVLAELASLVNLQVGVDARLDEVELEIDGVRAKVLLKVRLDEVRAILNHALNTVAEHPESSKTPGTPSRRSWTRPESKPKMQWAAARAENRRRRRFPPRQASPLMRPRRRRRTTEEGLQPRTRESIPLPYIPSGFALEHRNPCAERTGAMCLVGELRPNMACWEVRIRFILGSSP